MSSAIVSGIERMAQRKGKIKKQREKKEGQGQYSCGGKLLASTYSRGTLWHTLMEREYIANANKRAVWCYGRLHDQSGA